MSSIILKFTGELSEVIELDIPVLPDGKKFERWGQATARIKSHSVTLESNFGIEHADVQHLLSQLIQVRPNEKIEWETMEGNLRLELKTSALGNVELSVVISSSKSFCRSAIFRMHVTTQQVELAISQLEAFLLPRDKKLSG